MLRRMSRLCEGFRMPADHGSCHAHREPASENLQGRKPRVGSVSWCRERAAALRGFEHGGSGVRVVATRMIGRVAAIERV